MTNVDVKLHVYLLTYHQNDFAFGGQRREPFLRFHRLIAGVAVTQDSVHKLQHFNEDWETGGGGGGGGITTSFLQPLSYLVTP